MPSLQEDLKTYANELFSKKDLQAGFRIVSEIAGLMGIAGLGATIGSIFLTPLLGAPVGMGVAKLITREVAKQYINLSAEERKQVRAVVKWINNGFNLGEQLNDE